MKKAILFEPELLARVERESPHLYEYYCNSPLSRFEFADFGTPDTPMYMQKRILEIIQAGLNFDNIDHSILMAPLQRGWELGKRRLLSEYESTTEPILKILFQEVILRFALDYCPCDAETLIKAENFGESDEGMFNFSTYNYALCIEAWKIMLANHRDYNDLCLSTKTNRKKDHPDKIDIFGYNASYN